MNNSVALQRQVGGSHYKRFKIQPLQLAERLAMQPTLVMAFKYLCRFDDKDGIKIGDVKGGKQDLEKAWHCLECYFEFGHKRSNVVDKRYMSMSDIDIIFAFLEQFSEIPLSLFNTYYKLPSVDNFILNFKKGYGNKKYVKHCTIFDNYYLKATLDYTESGSYIHYKVLKYVGSQKQIIAEFRNGVNNLNDGLARVHSILSEIMQCEN